MTSRTKREYLRELVREKNRWSRQLTDEERAGGFLGWHERGYLPHCDFPGLVQLVTFRLADSMPASRRGEWQHLLAIEDVREKRTKLESYLDRGHGCCRLHDPSVAQLSEETLLHFHEARYEMLAWCVMPNHAHVLLHVWETPLWKLVRSWKQYIQTQANAMERRPPARPERNVTPNSPCQRPALQWQREYWDTYMREEEQELKAVRYIENNPVKAGFCAQPGDWASSSARFRDEYCRLVVPERKPTGTPTSGRG